MKKTNIRINNNFLIKKNDQYFLSDITNQDQWINTDNLVNHKGKNITSKLQELKEQYKINYSVNFITEQSGGWYSLKNLNQNGGWDGSFAFGQKGGWGGAGGAPSLNRPIGQKGGWGPQKN